MTLAPAAVEDTIEKNISAHSFEESGARKGVGQGPIPPVAAPGLTLVFASVPEARRQTPESCGRPRPENKPISSPVPDLPRDTGHKRRGFNSALK